MREQCNSWAEVYGKFYISYSTFDGCYQAYSVAEVNMPLFSRYTVLR